MEKTVIFWFRSDLRLHDQPALKAAIDSGASTILPVYCHLDQDMASPWGFARQQGLHRRYWIQRALQGLERELTGLGSTLLHCLGAPEKVLPELARSIGTRRIYCESIAAPYEEQEVVALRAAGLSVTTVWQSSMLDPYDLPWPAQKLPASFTPFRQAIESARIQPPAPLSVPIRLPAAPDMAIPAGLSGRPATLPAPFLDPRSSFPYTQPEFDGTEQAGLTHLEQYLHARRPHTYKQTRNDLTGTGYSSKWSPWLATGSLSAREVMSQLRGFEESYGANDGSYWLWFELLWRDYFRFLHRQYGQKLYRQRGLADFQPPRFHAASGYAGHNEEGFWRWCHSETGQPLIDAAMRELRLTGFLSNRLRQIVASYLVHDIGGDWRAGAAWFESQLLDYDPYSNQGNWLYIAGRGTDPRGGRHFNLQKQMQQYDPQGRYQQKWSKD
ncbi:DASH family cryptochrome [Orrella marina]|uniref:Cryptochrome DASH n=1 Tax=Orrella marina TaxID=2163011 RepID=A0A2R4XKK5_9BURK|nr:DASH family cryptochrome [Orrella marina]AWB34337.1 DASH family cryptochrome [Orrella marina]